MRLRPLLAAAAVALAACASAPTAPVADPGLTTERFFDLDPAVLRAAVLTDPRVVFQAVDLNITVRSPQQPPSRYVIRLQQPLAPDPRLPPAPAGRGWQVLALAAQDALTLATVQQLLLSQPRGQGGEIGIAVTALPALVPAELVSALPLRIDLLLNNRDGWVTQVGATTVDTRHDPVGQGRR
jgi:hypothetical protein